MVAINLGCGSTLAPGWINIDNSPNARLAKFPQVRRLAWKAGLISDGQYNAVWDPTIRIHDLNKRLPFADGSVDYAYSSHCLEHLSKDAGRQLLLDVHRVLKPAGVVRLVVPDLRYGAKVYLEELDAGNCAADAGPRFLNWMQLSKPGHRDPHLWMYDEPSLLKLLTDCGFRSATSCRFRCGQVPNLDVLDCRPEGSLHVEARKHLPGEIGEQSI